MKDFPKFSQTQLVYIDDSGDPGLVIKKRVSDYFIIACVLMIDELSAQEIDLEINKFKSANSLPLNFEFKYTKSPKILIEKLLEILVRYDWAVTAVVVDKHNTQTLKKLKNIPNIYNHIITSAIKKLENLNNVVINIDGPRLKKKSKDLKTILRKTLNQNGTKKVKTIKMLDSKKNNLIQLADICAGSIHNAQKDKPTYMQIYKLVRLKIKDIYYE